MGDEQLDGFERWCRESGVRTGPLVHAETADGMRGVVASQRIGKGQTLVELPGSCVMRVSKDDPCPDRMYARYNDVWHRFAQPDKWYVRLGLKLLFERFTKGEESRVRGYISLLPKEIDPAAPVLWCPSQVEAGLRRWYPQLAASVARQREAWDAAAETILAYDENYMRREGRRGADAVAYSREDILWAFHMCVSRAFQGDFEPPLWEAFVPGLVLVRALLSRGKEESGSYVLLPMVDSHNHDSRHGANRLDWNPSKKAFELVSQRPYDCGEQVFISYGDLSNDQLFQRFAFVEPDNPNDVFVFDPSQLRAAAAALGLVQTQSGPQASASAPAAEDVPSITLLRYGQLKDEANAYRRLGKSIGCTEPQAKEVVSEAVRASLAGAEAMRSDLGEERWQNDFAVPTSADASRSRISLLESYVKEKILLLSEATNKS